MHPQTKKSHIFQKKIERRIRWRICWKHKIKNKLSLCAMCTWMINRVSYMTFGLLVKLIAVDHSSTCESYQNKKKYFLKKVANIVGIYLCIRILQKKGKQSVAKICFNNGSKSVRQYEEYHATKKLYILIIELNAEKSEKTKREHLSEYTN